MFKALMISQDPFPSSAQQDQFSVDAWAHALKKVGFQIPLDSYATSVVAFLLPINLIIMLC